MDPNEELIKQLMSKAFESRVEPSASLKKQAAELYEKYVALRLAGYDVMDATLTAIFWIPRNEDDA